MKLKLLTAVVSATPDAGPSKDWSAFVFLHGRPLPGLRLAFSGYSAGPSLEAKLYGDPMSIPAQCQATAAEHLVHRACGEPMFPRPIRDRLPTLVESLSYLANFVGSKRVHVGGQSEKLPQYIFADAIQQVYIACLNWHQKIFLYPWNFRIPKFIN